MSLTITKMLNEIDNLSLADKLELIEKVIHNLKMSENKKYLFDWNELYGLGKGIWDNLDAQEYVNKYRAERP